MDPLPGGVMAFAPMSDLLQLPQSERLALAIALWDSLDDQARDGALSVDPALCAELDRRWASHLDNPDPELQRLRQQASSTAIETGQSVAAIERELRNRQSPQSTPA
jgi:putative addiction module component (TIGR02574 family)